MKKYLVIVTSIVLVALSLVACGDKKSEMSKNLQEEYGMSEKDAEMYVEAASDYAEAIKENAENVENAEAAFKLCSVSDEIKKSDISDEICQIGSIVFPTDGSITVKDFVERLSSEQNIMVGYDNSITDASLAQAGDGTVFTINVFDEFGESVYDLTCVNELSEIVPVYDCKVVDIDESSMDTSSPGKINGLNFFYAGDLCAGINTSNPVSDTEEYKERSIDYPRMTFHDVKEQLLNKGAERVVEIDTRFETFVFSHNPVYSFDGVEYYRAKRYIFYTDMSTSEVFMKVDKTFAPADRMFYTAEMDEALPTATVLLEEVISSQLSHDLIDRADEKVNIVGYYEKDNSPIAICRTDRDTYENVEISFGQRCDGKYSGNCLYRGSYDPFDSLEALCDKVGINKSDIIMVD